MRMETSIHSRGTGELFVQPAEDKNMGNYWVCFWLIAFQRAREVLELVGKEGSEHKCSESPRRLEYCKRRPVPSNADCWVMH